MSIRSEVVAALRQAGRRLTRAELLEHAPSALDDEKKLASNLYVMKTDGIVLTKAGEDGLEYELGPNADTVVADTSTPAHQVAPPPALAQGPSPALAARRETFDR